VGLPSLPATVVIETSPSLITVPVDLGPKAYPVRIGPGALGQLGEEILARGFKPGVRVLVVTNPDVDGPYGDRALRSLERSGFRSERLVLEAGEDQKTLATVSRIHQAAYDHQLERGSLIVALGGGVVGDMAGFAAATWLRGIAVVQVPTTLLAMVDAAIGGKTGVNHPGGKNLIGAFHQPSLVLVDPSTLATLPPRELQAGMAEVIKYGVIADPVLFEALERQGALATLDDLGPALLGQILRRSATAKARVVAADEREGSLRAILNYGHTLGHVVETLTGYRRYLHGEAVAIGMVAAGILSRELGLWSGTEEERQRQLIAGAGLPLEAPPLDPEAVRECLLRDKKVRDGRVRFVLPTQIGAVELRDDVPLESALGALMQTTPARS
jgi:3-dehydroquinate synthase